MCYIRGNSRGLQGRIFSSNVLLIRDFHATEISISEISVNLSSMVHGPIFPQEPVQRYCSTYYSTDQIGSCGKVSP